MKRLFIFTGLLFFTLAQAMEITWEYSADRIAREAKLAKKIQKRAILAAKKQEQLTHANALMLLNSRLPKPAPVAENNETLHKRVVTIDIAPQEYKSCYLSRDGLIAACVIEEHDNTTNKLHTVIRFFDTNTGKMLQEIDRYAKLYKFFWASDNQRCLIQFKGLKILVFDVKFGELRVIANKSCERCHPNSFNVKSNMIFLTSPGGGSLYNAITGSFIRKINTTNFAWSKSGEFYACRDKCLTIAEASSQEIVVEFERFKNPIKILWSPDDAMIAAIYGDKPIVEIARYDWMARVISGDLPIYTMAWSPDSSKIAILRAKDIEIWRVEDGVKVATLPVNITAKSAGRATIRWNPEGTKIFVHVLKNIRAFIWNIATETFEKINSVRGIILAHSWAPNSLTLVCAEKRSSSLVFYHIPNKNAQKKSYYKRLALLEMPIQYDN